jgi:hypothetical protein
MNCEKLTKLFNDCSNFTKTDLDLTNINGKQEFIKEAKLYNCILLSKELRKQCKSQDDIKININKYYK